MAHAAAVGRGADSGGQRSSILSARRARARFGRGHLVARRRGRRRAATFQAAGRGGSSAVAPLLGEFVSGSRGALWVALLAGSCSASNGEEERRRVLEQLGQGVIMPTLEEAVTSADVLATRVNAFVASPS